MPTRLIIEGIGIIGMGIILLNLYLLEAGKEKAKSRKYLLIGFVGSVILTAYSFITGSVLFTILNFVFVLVNMYWLFKIKTAVKKKSKRK